MDTKLFLSNATVENDDKVPDVSLVCRTVGCSGIAPWVW